MIQIHAYLNFQGKCREAMEFYQQCLGGKLELVKVAESPMAAQLPSQKGAEILHSRLHNEALVLMGSDLSYPNTQSGHSISLCLECNELNKAQEIFDALSKGGRLIQPLHQTFWGATYGEFIDRYEIRWMLNCNRN